MNDTPTKTYTAEIIKQKLAEDDRWLIRGILCLYRFQTMEEQYAAQTREVNGVGFNGVDGPFLSSLAEQIQSGRSLTTKQIIGARKAMMKYCKQLCDVANGK
jgi:anaerobic glycerol-3-phosphate dehydrogenase